MVFILGSECQNPSYISKNIIIMCLLPCAHIYYDDMLASQEVSLYTDLHHISSIQMGRSCSPIILQWNPSIRTPLN